MKTIDCRGLNCPEPVLRTKKALNDNPSGKFTIVVDNETARDNVLRMISSMGKTTEWSETNGVFSIAVTGSSEEHLKSDQVSTDPLETDRAVIFISTDQLGQGSNELGRMLMRNFIYTLTKREDLPQAVVLMNSGINLSIEESPVLAEFKELESRGVVILVCGTCLDYYEMKEQHQVGQVSNMYDIADLLFSAKKIISI